MEEYSAELSDPCSFRQRIATAESGWIVHCFIDFFKEKNGRSALSLFITNAISHYCILVFFFCSQSTARTFWIHFFSNVVWINVSNMHVGIKGATTSGDVYLLIDLFSSGTLILYRNSFQEDFSVKRNNRWGGNKLPSWRFMCYIDIGIW